MDTLCISAEQARARTSIIPQPEILEITTECLSNISRKIEEAANKGYMYIIYNVRNELSEKIRTLESSKIYFLENMDMALHRVRDYLETLNYEINSFCREDEMLHRISWGG